MEVHGSDRQAARRDALSALKERHDALVEWLEREAADCVAEQRHLEEGTVERIYWHYRLSNGVAGRARDVSHREHLKTLKRS